MVHNILFSSQIREQSSISIVVLFSKKKLYIRIYSSQLFFKLLGIFYLLRNSKKSQLKILNNVKDIVSNVGAKYLFT